ncbi:MAG: ATP-dependent RNA helicase RhlE [Planctomycetota bacterium]|jgi:ATP-dependent RNA helicase RhlE
MDEERLVFIKSSAGFGSRNHPSTVLEGGLLPAFHGRHLRPSVHNRIPHGIAPSPSDPPPHCCVRTDRERQLAHHAATLREPDISNNTAVVPSQVDFDHFELRGELRQAVADAEFRSPRPIQEHAIPPALAGQDVLGLAQTGTGKTVAFALPILQRLLDSKQTNARGPRALVVAPTRELASQVHAEFERMAIHTRISSTAIFGGVPIMRQVRALRRGPEVIVACPGRLLDLVNRGSLRLDDVEVLVLDEADHMFDMGFLPDVRRIVSHLPQRRQNLMFSATMSREIRKLADSVLRKPAVIELANARPAETIEHAIYTLNEGDKIGALEHLLSKDDFRSAIVFLRTKRRAKMLAQRLGQNGFDSVAMQGNMSQAQRERALKGFRSGQFNVLVATDIAARGLDIAGVSHVVNFDVPGTPDAYTHRIGRTGRSEQTGSAFTFATRGDSGAIRAIEQRLGEPIRRLQVGELGQIDSSSLSSGAGRRQAGGRGQGQGQGGHRSGPARGGRSTKAASTPRVRKGSKNAAAKARVRSAARPEGQATGRTTAQSPAKRALQPAFGIGISASKERQRPDAGTLEKSSRKRVRRRRSDHP